MVLMPPFPSLSIFSQVSAAEGDPSGDEHRANSSAEHMLAAIAQLQ